MMKVKISYEWISSIGMPESASRFPEFDEAIELAFKERLSSEGLDLNRPFYVHQDHDACEFIYKQE